jgi:predicted nucleic acid-binding protein
MVEAAVCFSAQAATACAKSCEQVVVDGVPARDVRGCRKCIWFEQRLTSTSARKSESQSLGRILSALPVLYPTDATWSRMESWVTAGTVAGQRFGVGDLLVAALAVEHGCTLWSLDSDFARMARLRMVTLAEV